MTAPRVKSRFDPSLNGLGGLTEIKGEMTSHGGRMEDIAWPVVASLAFVGILLLWEPVSCSTDRRKIAGEFKKRSTGRTGQALGSTEGFAAVGFNLVVSHCH